MTNENEEQEDICGLCGGNGADKFAHPVHWPTEQVPDGSLVHDECEREETKRAHAEFMQQVGPEGVKKFLRSI
jgi:hypothetical protein